MVRAWPVSAVPFSLGRELGYGLRLEADGSAYFSEANVSLGEQLRAVWRQAGGLADGLKDGLTMRWDAGPRNASRPRVNSGPDMEAGAVDLTRRRTLALPSILSPYGSGFGPGVNGIPKPTPANLRRFAETPVVRRAINVIKDRIVAMDWQVRVRRGVAAEEVGYLQRKLRALRRTLEEPNATDSFRTLLEQAVPTSGQWTVVSGQWPRRAAARRSVDLYPNESAVVYSVWAGAAGGGV